MDAIGIGHEDLYASWRNAHKHQAFGAPFSENLKFLDVRNWPKVTSTVRAAFNDVKLAHGASQRLGADLIDVIGGLDGDDFSSIAPKYARIIERAKGDPGFAVLCNPVRTEALRAVFPSDESATREVWHGSSENVRASIASKPPPDVPGGLGLEQIEQATIDAAQAAFGRVVHRRKGTRFGADYVAALRWLRDSVIWVIGKMWKHVKSFAFVAAMIFAVVLTYCMFMDREYTTHLAVDRTGSSDARPTFVPVFATTEETQTRAGIAGREYGAGVCAVIYTGMDCIVRMALDSGYAGLARTLDTFFGAGSTKKGHEALAQWAAIDIAERREHIKKGEADGLRQNVNGAELYAALTGTDIKSVKPEDLSMDNLSNVYDRKRSSVAEIQRRFAAALLAESQLAEQRRKEEVIAEAFARAKVVEAEAKVGEAEAAAATAQQAATQAKESEQTAEEAKKAAEARANTEEEKRKAAEGRANTAEERANTAEGIAAKVKNENSELKQNIIDAFDAIQRENYVTNDVNLTRFFKDPRQQNADNAQSGNKAAQSGNKATAARNVGSAKKVRVGGYAFEASAGSGNAPSDGPSYISRAASAVAGAASDAASASASGASYVYDAAASGLSDVASFSASTIRSGLRWLGASSFGNGAADASWLPARLRRAPRGRRVRRHHPPRLPPRPRRHGVARACARRGPLRPQPARR